MGQNPALSGFKHAPVSKGIVLATAGASILAQAARASRRQLPPGLGTASNLLVLRNPAELLFGALLLYYFRLLERQTGSNKFGAFAFVSTGLSYSLQLALSKLGGTFSRPLPSGPYGLIFACLVQFFCTVPASSKFTVLGWRLSDKAFIYLTGAQLLLSGGLSTLLAGGAGLAAGILYRANVCSLQRFRLPRPLTRVLSAMLGPLLIDSSPQRTAAGTAAAADQGDAAAGAPAAPGGATGQRLVGGSPGSMAARAGAYAAAGGGGGGMMGVAAAAAVDASALEQLVGMGFSEDQARRALMLAHNDVAAAITLLV